MSTLYAKKGGSAAMALLFLATAAMPAKAALLTFGNASSPLGGNMCADVTDSNTTIGTVVQAWQCHGAGNQQFLFNRLLIYAMSGLRCLRANGSFTGAFVELATCNSSDALQSWYYLQGQIRLFTGGLCLDAGSGVNGTPLKLGSCVSGSPNINWQIK